MSSVLTSLNFEQIGIFVLQGTLIFSLILFLFHLRKYFGLSVLFILLGVLQSMQVYMASTVYFKISEGFMVSPGSSVLFVASLFVILLIYIKEEAAQIRKIIFALLIANLVISILMYSFGWNIQDTSTINPYKLPTEIFQNNAWILVVGCLVLFLDSLLIILIYELTARKLNNLFFQVLITMLIVVSFDALLFSVIAFWGRDNLGNIIFSGLLSKAFFAAFYSIIFSSYLKLFCQKDSTSPLFNLKDIFMPLSFQQKFKNAQKDILKATEKAKLSESKYRTLTEISPVGIFHSNMNGELTFANNRLCEIFNLSQKELLGNGWQCAIQRTDLKKIQEGWQKALRHQTSATSEFRIVSNEGKINWALGHIVPESKTKSNNAGYVGTVTDISVLKNIEKQQVALRRKAEKNERLKSVFLANMSHEIRTPMNGILGFSNLLKEPKLSGEKKMSYLKIIEESGTRMLTIIDNLINISKIESGIIEVRPKKVNINTLLDNIYEIFSIEAASKKIKLTALYELSDDESIFVIDEEKVFGIITNLVKNAIKFTHQGGVEFGYKRKKNRLEFFVKDSGIGIPKNRLNLIFERFAQSENAQDMPNQGAGLGLTISKAYVELLKGKIWVESEVEKGTQFYFSIPIETEISKKSTSRGPFGLEIEKPIEKEMEKKLKILLVEDDEASLQLMLIKLKKFGKTIFCARKGQEALKICRSNPDLDLILMDIRLPESNGYDLTREIRTFNKEVIIIAQTAFAFNEDVEKALDAGCNDHMAKPINLRMLSNLIVSYFYKS